MSASQLKSIQEWASSPTPDSARLLIRTYHESEWRSSRLEVIRALGRFSDSRSLQFLVEVIKGNLDLAEQELAILSLSRQKTRGARYFLKFFYPVAPETLRPAVAYALGQAQVFSMSDELLKSFQVALAKQDVIWLKNIILSLGELKVFHALPRLRQLIEGGVVQTQEIQLSVLFAIGRLERDPQQLIRYENLFLDDSLLWQVYQSVLTQVQIRSQFKLEDYLSKIFEGDKPHPVLPLELKAFDPSDVQLGLSLFDQGNYWKRYLLCLKALSASLQNEILLKFNFQDEEWSDFFYLLADSVELDHSATLMEGLAKSIPSISGNLEVRLSYLSAFLQNVNWEKEAEKFLQSSEGNLGIRFLNLWSEWAIVESEKQIQGQIRTFLKFKLSDSVFARLLRACVELGVDDKSIHEQLIPRFQSLEIRSTLLLYAETFHLKELLPTIRELSPRELEKLGVRILSFVESIFISKKINPTTEGIDKILGQFEKDSNPEHQVGLLRVLRHLTLPAFEPYVISSLKSTSYPVELNAVIALKSYKGSRPASEALVDKLQSTSDIIQGRALDALCKHSTLVAKRGVMDFLAHHLEDEQVVDKIYRDFDPEKKGGAEFFTNLVDILKKNPDHPQWEKLVSLRDRLQGAVEAGESSATDSNPELVELDARLELAIPKFKSLDPTTKLALRAAEQPFLQTGLAENLPIDKAPTVLEYCKALDLILERHLGQKHLFPKLDRELHDFQTLWHRVGFGEDYPQADRVMTLLGLKGKITPEHFPLHKAKMMCGTFFNGKIVQDRFKIFDGLRAWAVIFLVFARKIPLQTGAVGPILKLTNGTDEKCILIAKKLMSLQDLRNPAAHRQTYNDLNSVKAVRNEAVELTNTILELVL
jgi:hypothetical protein